MKKSIFFTAFFILLLTASFAQSSIWNTEGFTRTEDIIIIDELTESSGMQKGELIFSKAKGFISFSAINSINNRALEKLKTEASIRGASHIHITDQSIENSVFSKSSMYTARLYKESVIDPNQARTILAGKRLTIGMGKKYSRNGWKSSSTFQSTEIDINSNDPIEEKNGRIYLKQNNKNVYEIVAIDESKMLLFQERKKGTKFSLLGVSIQ
ncbi:hypothetical protein MM213_07775 [Belliella sp. R4-6]|uniref:Uncharacterized protein n=1 Tax=Belliella alkalica TaxID=1730871 RepID=A0ABS9VAB1_9BACT|nr:hypothetical protein [Belliella alkalica]MCH7413377.1 hypothetical protein [Belliella alkalica]